ncbi:MAG: helix-turn-helix transcriptional regulator [Carnobacterium sp.]|uniref:helix-turn-helix domain-containing protein n=1 Tax=Carnobacterium sp. TaxID=48221 RepID=UPI003315C945
MSAGMNLYDNVKSLAARKGMSLPEFSEKMGLSKTAMYTWQRSTPGVEIIDRIAKYFDVSIEFLIGSDHIPEWSKGEKILEFDSILKSNIPISYGELELTDVEKKRAKTVLDALFWDKI